MNHKEVRAIHSAFKKQDRKDKRMEIIRIARDLMNLELAEGLNLEVVHDNGDLHLFLYAGYKPVLIDYKLWRYKRLVTYINKLHKWFNVTSFFVQSFGCQDIYLKGGYKMLCWHSSKTRKWWRSIRRIEPENFTDEFRNHGYSDHYNRMFREKFPYDLRVA